MNKALPSSILLLGILSHPPKLEARGHVHRLHHRHKPATLSLSGRDAEAALLEDGRACLNIALHQTATPMRSAHFGMTDCTIGKDNRAVAYLPGGDEFASVYARDANGMYVAGIEANRYGQAPSEVTQWSNKKRESLRELSPTLRGALLRVHP